MSYESFQRDKDNCFKHHITIDNILSCLAIIFYMGGLTYVMYRYFS